MTTLALASAPPPLATFFDEARTAVEAELDRRLRAPVDDPGRLAAAMHYAATGPGKRLRPALVLAAAEACGDRASALPASAAPRVMGNASDAALAAAAAVEMLHAYTLVHDDLPAMDDDDVRRGRPTVHKAFGEAIAILAGDGLLTAAFATLAELGPRAADAVAVLARRAGARELLLGQAIDLTQPPTDLPSIERMHAAKTGALFAAAAELGAIAAGAPRATCEALGRYGLAIGIAFQHADDRDDEEFIEHAVTASARIRELCADARNAVEPLGARATLLVLLAEWIASRA